MWWNGMSRPWHWGHRRIAWNFLDQTMFSLFLFALLWLGNVFFVLKFIGIALTQCLTTFRNWELSQHIQWWFVYPDTFVPGQYFRIEEFSGLLNSPLAQTWKLVPTLFVRTSKISGLSEPGLKNHHCMLNYDLYQFSLKKLVTDLKMLNNAMRQDH